jgi:small-conductance mechanosensitive channel
MDDLLQQLTALTAAASLRAIVGGAVFVLFWVAARAVGFLVRRLERRVGGRRRRRQVLALVSQTVTSTILLFGGVTALGTMGINVSALVAGLGLTGFALGFALKDAISNVLAGVLILLYEPFGIEDRIAVVGLEGTVASIDPRYTILTSEDRRYLIPNALLMTNTVTVLERAREPHLVMAAEAP